MVFDSGVIDIGNDKKSVIDFDYLLINIAFYLFKSLVETKTWSFRMHFTSFSQVKP